MPLHNLFSLTDFTVGAVFDFARHDQRLKDAACGFSQAMERALPLNTGLPRVIVRHRPTPTPLTALAMNC